MTFEATNNSVKQALVFSIVLHVLPLWYYSTKRQYDIYILPQERSRPFVSDHSDECWNSLAALATIFSYLLLWFPQ